MTKVRAVAGWVWQNRRKVAAVLVLAVPLATRFVPDFPADEVLALLRAYLGT
ncbi:hypothetical protein [Streptomyces sp. NPDC015414]|uniref:hypothetical protein n=1 Tax=Streptomyces sp. NPDC015414 TaxID=3364957 RepID=UPI0036F6FA4C